MNRPYSPSADRNKEAIGDALADYLANAGSVLEVGSGTGQHGIYLSERFKNLQWQPTEQQAYLQQLNEAIAAEASTLLAPVQLTIKQDLLEGDELNALPDAKYSFAYSANTAHIMSIEEVAMMFQVVARKLDSDALFALYGPFKIDGQHTSAGNKAFDSSLKSQQPHMGIRDKGELQLLAGACGMTLQEDISMPSNNRILLWRLNG